MSSHVAAESANLWEAVEELVRSSRVVVDRPAGSRHPRCPELVYPLDYGYLEGTTAGDGEGIDVWRGSGDGGVRALLATVDGWKRDSEVKYLVDVTDDEIEAVGRFYGRTSMGLVVVRRPVNDG